VVLLVDENEELIDSKFAKLLAESAPDVILREHDETFALVILLVLNTPPVLALIIESILIELVTVADEISELVSDVGGITIVIDPDCKGML